MDAPTRRLPIVRAYRARGNFFQMSCFNLFGVLSIKKVLTP